MPATIRAARKLLERYPLSEWLLYKAYDSDDQVFELSDGRVGVLWKMPPLIGISHDALGVFQSIFDRDLPTGTTMQWQFFTSSFIEPHLDSYVEARRGGSQPIYEELAKREREFFLAGRDRHLIPSTRMRPRVCEVYVSMTLPLDSGFMGGSKALALELLGSVQSALEMVWGSWVKRVDAYGLKLFLFELLNPGHGWHDRPRSYDDGMALSDQMILYDSTTDVSEGLLEIDGKYVKSLTAREFPKQWSGFLNHELVGHALRPSDQIRCPFLMTLNCLWLDRNKTSALVTNKHLMITHQAGKALLNVIPRLREKKENFDVMQKELSMGGRPLGLYFHVLLYDESVEAVERRSQEVKGLFIKNAWEMQDDSYIGLPLFLNALPLHLSNDESELRDRLRRLKTLHSKVAPHLMPVIGDWQGFGVPVFLGVTRAGQLFHFDLFSNQEGGFSMCVAGKTGSGKSFFTNKMLMSYLGVGARCWVIDLGHSYEKLCTQVKGQWIELKERQNNLCFNPFSFLTMADGQQREEKGQLGHIFEKMIAPRDGMNDLQRSFLQEALDRVLRNEGREGSPESVWKVLHEHSESRARDLAHMLVNYRRSGMYGKMFNGRGNLEFDNPFVVMELEGFEGTPDLMSVILLQLIMTIQGAIVSEDRAVRKICIMDEAWRFFSSSGTGGGGTQTVSDFFTLGARTFRKYGGCIMCVSQGVNDYFDQMGRNGVAIWENADFTGLFSQKAESIAALRNQQKLSLTDHEYQLLNSVHRQGGEYSECMLVSPMGRGVIQIVVDDYTRYLFSTKAEDISRLTRHQKNGLTLLEAIDQCVGEDHAA